MNIHESEVVTFNSLSNMQFQIFYLHIILRRDKANLFLTEKARHHINYDIERH